MKPKEDSEELVDGEVKKEQKKGPRYERFFENEPNAFEVVKKKEPEK